MERLMLDAAQCSYGLLRHPQPFVLVDALEDYAVRYQLNAYTQKSHEQSKVYSELHKHIIDHFNEAGIEIMSPNYVVSRTGEGTTIPAGPQKHKP